MNLVAHALGSGLQSVQPCGFSLLDSMDAMLALALVTDSSLMDELCGVSVCVGNRGGVGVAAQAGVVRPGVMGLT